MATIDKEDSPNVASPVVDVEGQEVLESVSTRKRTLLKAGWIAPLIVAVKLPLSSFAANASERSGSDTEDHGNKHGGGKDQKDKGGGKKGGGK